MPLPRAQGEFVGDPTSLARDNIFIGILTSLTLIDFSGGSSGVQGGGMHRSIYLGGTRSTKGKDKADGFPLTDGALGDLPRGNFRKIRLNW